MISPYLPISQVAALWFYTPLIVLLVLVSLPVFIRRKGEHSPNL